ncbi:MAG: NUDIX hydrolase [Rhodothermia bacterium]|nr:NUDIX hydrolase [Rhodothermia bacterium]
MKKDLTERSLDSLQLVDGVLLKAHRDTVALPDGGESVREWIDHPGASAVVPLFDDGSTILVRQFRFPPRREFLEVPAGKLDVENEDPIDVAHRELEEETGWKAASMTRISSLYPCIGYSNEVIHFFVARGMTKGQMSLSDGEFVEGVRMPFDDAVQLAVAGELQDMKTVVALFLARDFLRSNGGTIERDKN